MKKIILILSVLITYSSARVVQQVTPHRRYFSDEEFEDYKRFIYIENDNHEIELVDLKQGPIEKSADKSTVRYYLFTQSNPTTPNEILNGDVTTLDSTNYDPTKHTFFIIHGWRSSRNSSMNINIQSAAIKNNDINIFIVDWSDISENNYLTAWAGVTTVGEFIGKFIENLLTKYAGVTDESKIHLVGHSLGAHVAGNAGAVLNGTINSILALDPAGPLFTLGNTANRVDETDAQFVQVIHTNGLLLGFRSAIGHSDYYPNGGFIQPGCSMDITGGCSHARSHQYYVESLQRGPVFDARECTDFDNYQTGSCGENDDSPMGLLKVDVAAFGDYYLETNTESPFGKS